jgi:hypothetical protein
LRDERAWRGAERGLEMEWEMGTVRGDAWVQIGACQWKLNGNGKANTGALEVMVV